MTRTIDLTFTRQDKAASHYHYLPFDVPEGTTRIDIGFALKRSDDCQLDFGLLDPTATDFPSATGLRGWTGGASSVMWRRRGRARCSAPAR